MKNVVVGVIGPKGSGKTTVVRRLVESRDRLAVFDTVQESAYLEIADEVIIGNPSALCEAMKCERFKIIYRTFHIDTGFANFAKYTYLCGKLTVVIEEVDRVCSPWYTDDDLENMVNIGRHREVNIIYVCRSAAEVSKKLTRNTDVLILFGMHEPRDLESLADRIGSEKAEEVSRLGRYEYIVWKAESQTPERITFADEDSEE